MSLLVASLPGDPGLGRRLASLLGLDHVMFASKRFPDGETYVRIDVNKRYDTIIVVDSMYPNQNDRFMEMLLGIEAAKELARQVIVVAPYLAYSRQDRRFLPGEPVSIAVVLSSLSRVGARSLITVDIHKPESLSFFEGRTVNIDPAPAFAKSLSNVVSSDTIVIAPDKGAIGRAKSLARRLGLEYDFLEKSRDRVTGEVTYKPKALGVKGRTAIIVDDIISTGGTVAKTAETLYGQGASEVIVVCSHGLFVGNAIEKLRRAGIKRIYAANTIPLPENIIVVDISDLVASAVRNLVHGVEE